MMSLVRHLHGFIRDFRLTKAEFREAASVLSEIQKDRSGLGSIADFNLAAVLIATRVTLNFKSAALADLPASAGQANDLA